MEQIIIDSSQNNPKLYWKSLRQFIKTHKNAEIIPPLRSTSHDGSENFYFTDQDKANCLNDCFVSMSSVDDPNIVLPDLPPRTLNTLENILISESEIIIDVIDALNPSKTDGENTIHHKVLKAPNLLLT